MRRRISIGSGIVLIGGIALASALLYPVLFPKVKLYKTIPPSVFERQPEVFVAFQAYQAKGAKYIWGDNDCSIFVMDYILATGRSVPFRPTTATLMDSTFLPNVGFSAQPKPAKTGDIIVYRYQNADQQWRGHTGVVVWHNDQHWVVHNAQSFNGVVMQDIEEFYKQANRLTNNNPTLTRIYRRNDWNSWYAEFSRKREETKNL